MLLANLVSGRYGRSNDGVVQASGPTKNWVSRLLQAIFRRS
jgi:hypothetical protein